MKIGLFGGSFNPPHLGHLNLIQTVVQKVGLNKVHVVPNFQNPLKKKIEGATSEQRLEMTRIAFVDRGPTYFVDDQEIVRGGTSYTYETAKNLVKNYPHDEIYLIVGADNFETFNSWKNYQALLEIVNLVVTSRPGWDLPRETADLPEFIQNLVEEFDFNFVELKSGKSIQFIRLQDIEVSASELRKKLRIGKNVEKLLPLGVETYLHQNKIYGPMKEKIGDF